MIPDPSPASWFNSPKSGSGKRRFTFRRKPQEAQHRVGLLPAEGWRKRNMQFIGEVLIPHMLRPRKPGHAAEAVPVVSEGDLGVTWLGHAGFLVQIGGLNVAIDPNWALWHGPVKRVRHPSLLLSDMPKVDLVLITHAHFDHLHLPSLRALARGQPVIAPKGVGTLMKGSGFGRIIELETWQKVRYRGLTITLTPARHWGARYIHDTYRHFGGFIIEFDGRTVYHCGDSAMFDGFGEIANRHPVEIALLPIGAYDCPSGRPVHMNPEEALDVFQMIGAQKMIPMHHDTFPISGEPLHEPMERLVRGADERDLRDSLRVLREGQSIIL
jgi:L-ascorbate metabolism protein UlaG (beta-lactamase superfamily)